MSSSPITYENKSLSNERRSVLREPLKWVVLVYFGLDNWGKLIDLSESGMRFEFAQPPSDRERINFTFEAMGCLPGPPAGRSSAIPSRPRATCDGRAILKGPLESSSSFYRREPPTNSQMAFF